MGRAKIGFVVGGILIASALGVYGCNHVHLVKKQSSDTVSQVEDEQRGIEIQGTEPIQDNNSVELQKDETSVITTTIEPNIEVTETETTTTVETGTTTAISMEVPADVESGKLSEGLTQIEIPEINSVEQSSVGVVVDKCAFLTENGQVVFSVKVKLPVGTKDVMVDYYCTYSTFKSLELNTELSVIYQSIENGNIVIISANRV